jgi:hypothetical protein
MQITRAENVRQFEANWYEPNGINKVEFRVRTWLY